jgi:hypothetical protein
MRGGFHITRRKYALADTAADDLPEDVKGLQAEPVGLIVI